VFGSGTIAYTATVLFSTTSMTVTPTTADANATITVNGNPVASGSPSGAIALSVGANVISTQVTAEDGSTTKTYTLTVTRGAASTNADLSGLVPSGGTLTPVFDSATIAYTANVQFSTSSMTVTPTTANAFATITVNGNAVASGSPSGAIALSVGANVISTQVTAEDGTTTKTYTLTVNRAAVADLVTDFQATIASEENPTPAFTGEARFFHVSTNPANPGTGSYAATIVGTNTQAPAFVRNFDGPVLAYKFAGGTNNVITAVAQQGGSLGGGIITFTSTDALFDGFGQQQAKLWTSTDPGNDIKVTGATPAAIYGAVANTNTTGGWRSLNDATGTIDVSSIPAGSVHIYYGDFGAKPTLSVVMRDTALVDPAPDLTIANAHLNNDTANRTEYYLAEVDFVTDGVYDEVKFVWTSGAGNGRGLAVVVTEAAPADAVAPTLDTANITDNSGGNPISSVTPLAYTVTYSEFMDPASIGTDDFELLGTAGATVTSVLHLGKTTTVNVLPTLGTSGTIQLQVKAGAVITDLAGNALDTTAAITDPDSVTVSDVVAPTVVSIASPGVSGTIYGTPTITYTVTFSEFINPVTASNFTNAGTAPFTIGTVTQISGGAPAASVYTVQVIPSGSGTVQLQIQGTVEDPSLNPLTVPVTDTVVYTLDTGTEPERETVTLDASFTSAATTSTHDLVFDASASDKVVVIVTGENGNPGSLAGKVNSLTYDGVAMTKAVGRFPIATSPSGPVDQLYNDIWYLDNPAAATASANGADINLAVPGNIRASVDSRGVITAIRLSGTAPGVGATAISAQEVKSVSLLAATSGGMVLASYGMGGDGNTANVTAVNTTPTTAELTAVSQGSTWNGHVTSRTAVTSPGFVTSTFTGGNTIGTHTIAAEFLGALVVTDLFAAWSVLDGATGVTFAGDANDDGVQDGLAFLLGAANPNIDANAAGLLPTVTESGGDLVMEFDCLATADRGTALLDLEYDGDLVAPWLSAPVPGAVGNSTVNTATGSVSFVATANGDLIHIVATISDATESAGGKLFGRLEGTE
jgi:hypothetical protein